MGLSLSIQKRLLENLVSCSYFIVPQESKILIITKQMYQGSYRFNLQSFANFWLLVLVGNVIWTYLYLQCGKFMFGSLLSLITEKLY